MERRLNKKLETYITTFKDNIRDKTSQMGMGKNEQVNQLDEEIKLAKLKLLESKSKATIANLGMYVGIGVVVLGVLWFFTSKEN